MAFSEVYQALQTGVVDGTENPPSNLYTQKMHEVQKYVTLSDHGYLGYAVIVNKRFWDGLPDEVRAALEKAMEEATVYANDIAAEENAKAIEAVKAAGTSEIITLSAEEKLALKKALVPVHEQMSGRIGRSVIEEVYQATGFDPNSLR
jgi:C4-dicarboxylate-binding protein DctP